MTTAQIKAAIGIKLEARGFAATASRIAEVWRCYMITQCGHEVDLEDAIEAAGFVEVDQ